MALRAMGLPGVAMRAVVDLIERVPAPGAPREICRPVVVVLAVQVPGFHVIGARTREGFNDERVDGSRAHVPVSGEVHVEVRGGLHLELPEKSPPPPAPPAARAAKLLDPVKSPHSPQVGDLVKSLVTEDGQPALRGNVFHVGLFSQKSKVGVSPGGVPAPSGHCVSRTFYRLRRFGEDQSAASTCGPLNAGTAIGSATMPGSRPARNGVTASGVMLAVTANPPASWRTVGV